MVKKWIVVLSIITLLAVGCTLEYDFVNREFHTLEQKLEIYKTMLDETEDHVAIAENVEYIDDVHTYWHEKNKVLKSLIWHTGLKDIEVGMARIKTYVEENDYTEALTELESLIYYVTHYADDFKISFENIL